MAESFSRQKSRHAPQKEGGLKILCDLPPVLPRLVRPTNLMSRMDGKKTHTHTLLIPICIKTKDFYNSRKKIAEQQYKPSFCKGASLGGSTAVLRYADASCYRGEGLLLLAVGKNRFCILN